MERLRRFPTKCKRRCSCPEVDPRCAPNKDGHRRFLRYLHWKPSRASCAGLLPYAQESNRSPSWIRKISLKMRRFACQDPILRPSAENGPEVIDLMSDSETNDEDEGVIEVAIPGHPKHNRTHPQNIDSPPPDLPNPNVPQIEQSQQIMHTFITSAPNEILPRPMGPMNEAIVGRQTFGDYVLDEHFDEAFLAQLVASKFGEQEEQQHVRPIELMKLVDEGIQAGQVNQAEESTLQCVDKVAVLFPDICRDYVSGLYDTVSRSSDQLIAYILDDMEKGTPYAVAQDQTKLLKRKRDPQGDEDEEAARIYGALDRIIPSTGGNTGIRGFIRAILSEEFPETPMNFVDATLSQTGHRLFSAYRVLDEAQRTFDQNVPPYRKIKKARTGNLYKEENIDSLVASLDINQEKVFVLKELDAARRIREKAEFKRHEERQAVLLEEQNTMRAEAEGTMSECGCCYGDYPLNRMIHCENEVMHWFCRGCALRNAETEIGNSKYELKCMSMEGCDVGYSIEQRSQFLDRNTIIALERNEQEAVLRMAGIENLASCPFCPYAAEYPPVEENHEFKCQAPECQRISCRLCKLDSHIPKSCEEHAKENGLSLRRQIEEAMSAALIRKCNKCNTPFVKEEGCNKMTCTRKGCYNVQCYICSKSCSGYDHFDDINRGGKAGNCRLFESVEQRHDEEVMEAEKAALEKIRAIHPEYTEEDLKIKMSEEVLKDDEKRKLKDPRLRLGALRAAQDRYGQGNYMHLPLHQLRPGRDDLRPPPPFYPLPIKFIAQPAPIAQGRNPANFFNNDHAMDGLLGFKPGFDWQDQAHFLGIPVAIEDANRQSRGQEPPHHPAYLLAPQHDLAGRCRGLVAGYGSAGGTLNPQPEPVIAAAVAAPQDHLRPAAEFNSLYRQAGQLMHYGQALGRPISNNLGFNQYVAARSGLPGAPDSVKNTPMAEQRANPPQQSLVDLRTRQMNIDITDNSRPAFIQRALFEKQPSMFKPDHMQGMEVAAKPQGPTKRLPSIDAPLPDRLGAYNLGLPGSRYKQEELLPNGGPVPKMGDLDRKHKVPVAFEE